MENQNYTAANLSDQLIDEVKSLEEKLSAEVNKKVVVIAYENES